MFQFTFQDEEMLHRAHQRSILYDSSRFRRSPTYTMSRSPGPRSIGSCSDSAENPPSPPTPSSLVPSNKINIPFSPIQLVKSPHVSSSYALNDPGSPPPVSRYHSNGPTSPCRVPSGNRTYATFEPVKLTQHPSPPSSTSGGGGVSSSEMLALPHSSRKSSYTTVIPDSVSPPARCSSGSITGSPNSASGT